LAQKNVTISYVDSGDFSSLIVMGHLLNESEVFDLVLDRSQVPTGVRIYVDILDERARRKLVSSIQDRRGEEQYEGTELVFLEETTVALERPGGRGSAEALVTMPARARLKLAVDSKGLSRKPKGLSIGHRNGREVVWTEKEHKVNVPVAAGAGAVVP